MFNFIKNIFATKKQIPVPAGYCPNCWGRQEYQNQIIEAAMSQKIDLNNVGKHKGWIQAYAERNLLGLQLDVSNGRCKTCGTH